MKLFEVFLKDGRQGADVLTADAREQTGAQVFTQAEAEFVGLEGLPDDPEGRPRVFIAYQPADEKFIASRLEANEAVLGFKLHQLS
jgi:hypothetical protein